MVFLVKNKELIKIKSTTTFPSLYMFLIYNVIFLYAYVVSDSSMFVPHSTHVINKGYNGVTDFL